MLNKEFLIHTLTFKIDFNITIMLYLIWDIPKSESELLIWDVRCPKCNHISPTNHVPNISMLIWDGQV